MVPRPRPRRAPPVRPYAGPIPGGAVPATMLRVDPAGHFLFAHAASLGEDVYMHGALFGGTTSGPATRSRSPSSGASVVYAPVRRLRAERLTLLLPAG